MRAAVCAPSLVTQTNTYRLRPRDDGAGRLLELFDDSADRDGCRLGWVFDFAGADFWEFDGRLALACDFDELEGAGCGRLDFTDETRGGDGRLGCRDMPLGLDGVVCRLLMDFVGATTRGDGDREMEGADGVGRVYLCGDLTEG